MPGIRFTREATLRLAAIREFVAAESPVRAEALVRRVIERAESLATHPRQGRIVPEFHCDDLRELLVAPYRVVYRLQGDAVVVITVMHFRQLLPLDVGKRAGE